MKFWPTPRHNNQGPLTDAAIRRLFERIIDEARTAERLAMHGEPSKADKMPNDLVAAAFQRAPQLM